MPYLGQCCIYVGKFSMGGGGGGGSKLTFHIIWGVARKLNVLMYMRGIKWGVRFKQGGHMSLPPKTCTPAGRLLHE